LRKALSKITDDDVGKFLKYNFKTAKTLIENLKVVKKRSRLNLGSGVFENG
jgi:hypothetical protein